MHLLLIADIPIIISSLITLHCRQNDNTKQEKQEQQKVRNLYGFRECVAKCHIEEEGMCQKYLFGLIIFLSIQ